VCSLLLQAVQWCVPANMREREKLLVTSRALLSEPAQQLVVMDTSYYLLQPAEQMRMA
jgi:hypothetical protein